MYFIFIYLLIRLYWGLAAARRILRHVGSLTVAYELFVSMRDIVPWPGIKPRHCIGCVEVLATSKVPSHILQISDPQPFRHQEPVLWKMVLSQMGVGGWGDGLGMIQVHDIYCVL